MTGYTKIDFRHRRICEIEDITDIVALVFPGNANQQHAAARILLALKAANEPIASLRFLELQYNISRRTIERARAKLGHLGLIEHVSPFSRRANGHPGWRLSGRMSTALRRLAHKIEAWRDDTRRERIAKDERLAELMV